MLGAHLPRLALVQYRRDVPRGSLCLDNAAVVHEAQYGVDGFLGGALVYLVGGVGVDRESLRLPHLPVVVEGGGVVGAWLADNAEFQPEILHDIGVGEARVHHLDMGQEYPGLIEARQLYAVLVPPQTAENAVGYALGGLALVVAREHTVNVGVVHRPEALADVHGVVIHAGDNEYLAVLGYAPAGFELFELLHAAGADVHLLDFVAAHGPNYGYGFSAVSEDEPRDVKLLAVGRTQREKYLFLHFASPPAAGFSIRESSDPP